MTLISEISDDEPTMKLKQAQRRSLLPDEITETCVALVQRCHYPTLSLVSRYFHNLITSPELYKTRSFLKTTESVLYAYVGVPRFQTPCWYILHRKPYNKIPSMISLKLGKISSLPPLPWGSSVVAIGSEIYVIGGCDGEKRTKDVILIDCRSHTCRFLPSMRVARCRAAVGVIDGKIYVIGGFETRFSGKDWIEVFDVKEDIWISSKCSPEPYACTEFERYAVIEEKIYISDLKFCYVYEPKQDQWNSLGVNELSNGWGESSCVIDDMLFCISLSGIPITVYDPKESKWRPLKGLEGFPGSVLLLKESKMANFGGKLVILGVDDKSEWCSFKFKGKKEIWCVEIGLERRGGGEIWGKVESVEVVLTVPNWPASVELCRTVTV